MNRFIALSICAFVLTLSPQALATVSSTTTLQNDVVAHGGGCRKDSPPGKCCHAGSKPYHCH